ncbi:hypothetical protein ACVOMV_03215 [Mesorhizobium atlanticum]
MALRDAVASLPRPTVSDAFLARIAAIAEVKGAGEGDVTQPAAETAEPQQSSQQQQGNVIAMRPRGARWFNSFDWRQMAASIAPDGCSGQRRDAMADDGGQWGREFCRGRRQRPSPQPARGDAGRHRLVRPPHGEAVARRPDRRVAGGAGHGQDGYALLGGRVEVIGDRPMPALVYRHHEHLITLVAAPRQNDVEVGAGGGRPLSRRLPSGSLDR